MLLTQLLSRFEPAMVPDQEGFLNLYWYGIYEEDLQQCKNLLLIFDLFRYCLWKCKLRRKIPNTQRFMDEFKFVLSNCMLTNKSVRVSLENCNIVANLIPAQG